MSSLKRDSAMEDLPWPSSTARSSTSATSATAILTQDLNPSNRAVISDPADSEMTHKMTQLAPRSTLQWMHFLLILLLWVTPSLFLSQQGKNTPNPSDLAYSTSNQGRAVHTIYSKIWNPDSPYNPFHPGDQSTRLYQAI